MVRTRQSKETVNLGYDLPQGAAAVASILGIHIGNTVQMDVVTYKETSRCCSGVFRTQDVSLLARQTLSGDVKKIPVVKDVIKTLNEAGIAPQIKASTSCSLSMEGYYASWLNGDICEIQEDTSGALSVSFSLDGSLGLDVGLGSGSIALSGTYKVNSNLTISQSRTISLSSITDEGELKVAGRLTVFGYGLFDFNESYP